MNNIKLDILENVKNVEKNSPIDLTLFLPNYLKLQGSEDIFKISHSNARTYIDEYVEEFVVGLHLIELEYRSRTGNDFGFGSPSPTAKVISALEPLDLAKAQKLTEWVASNGGNYYIPKK